VLVDWDVASADDWEGIDFAVLDWREQIAETYPAWSIQIGRYFAALALEGGAVKIADKPAKAPEMNKARCRRKPYTARDLGDDMAAMNSGRITRGKDWEGPLCELNDFRECPKGLGP